MTTTDRPTMIAQASDFTNFCRTLDWDSSLNHSLERVVEVLGANADRVRSLLAKYLRIQRPWLQNERSGNTRSEDDWDQYCLFHERDQPFDFWLWHRNFPLECGDLMTVEDWRAGIVMTGSATLERWMSEVPLSSTEGVDYLTPRDFHQINDGPVRLVEGSTFLLHPEQIRRFTNVQPGTSLFVVSLREPMVTVVRRFVPRVSEVDVITRPTRLRRYGALANFLERWK